jgi:putative heme iron utilization protein
MAGMSDQALTARRLLNSQSVGVLSTHSVDVAGYPFGSIAPYILDYEGEPILLISDIAQHTRNIKQDNKVSLTVFEQGAADPQASSRLTWLGDAELIDPLDPELSQRYLRYFPSAASYFETHDFSFYRIPLRRARFIGGFGQIYWIEPAAMLLKNPFRQSERRIIEHMNQDHQQALFHYCKVLKGSAVETVAMTGIDSEGFDLLADRRKLRIDFESPIYTTEEARATLVRLARQ